MDALLFGLPLDLVFQLGATILFSLMSLGVIGERSRG